MSQDLTKSSFNLRASGS